MLAIKTWYIQINNELGSSKSIANQETIILWILKVFHSQSNSMKVCLDHRMSYVMF